MTTVTCTALGYRATREGDTLVVHDVPIFCACKRNDFEADEAWIVAAVKGAKQRAREGYLPPLHTRHHEAETARNDSVCAAGMFRVTRAEPITLGGQRRLAVIADLIITNPGTQEDVLRMRYPYRSVEIFDVDTPSIDGLALLDHEAPYLTMPLLVVSSVEDETGSGDVANATFCEGDQLDVRVGADPVVAFFRRGQSARFLFRGKPMADTDITFAEDTPPQDDEETQADGPAFDVGAIVSAIESGEISVRDMDAILVAIQNQSMDDEAPTEEPAAPAEVPGMMREQSVDMATFARVQGEVEALRARSEERDQTDARRADVTEALERLRDRPLGADLEERLTSFHAAHGAEAFRDYVTAMEQAAAVPPGSEPAVNGQLAQVPEVAMAYSAEGVDAIDRAANLCREWETLREAGLRVSEERYVRLNMTRSGVQHNG